MIGIYVKDGQAIANGSKTAVVTPVSRGGFSGARALIVREGGKAAIVGIVIFEKPVKVDAEGLKDCEAQHCINEVDRIRWWPKQDTFWIHRVKAFYPLEEPQPVEFRPGSTMQVDVPLEAKIVEVRNDNAEYSYTIGVFVADGGAA